MKLLVLLFISISLSATADASDKSICGGTDERVLSYDKRVARMLNAKDAELGCTGTLIGRTCMISAGHCIGHVNFSEFNTKASIGGKITHPAPEDIYKLDEVIDYKARGIGNDWMVFRLQANEVTGLYPGDVQGKYDVSFEAPVDPLKIRITGYGGDKRGSRNYAQQTATNQLLEIWKTGLWHNVDTQGGNSGSAVIDLRTQKIIGVHTNGGCKSDYGENVGTVLGNHEEFKAAVIKCLEEGPQ